MSSILRFVGTLTAVCALLWTVGLAWFVKQINIRVPSTEMTTDAVVVVNGERTRVEHAIAILIAGSAHKLLVSGVTPGAVLPAIEQLSDDRPELYACCVTLGYDAVDTSGNAREAARWLAAQNFHSMRLVTSDYQMPRAMLEFRRVLSDRIRILPDPVSPQETRIHFGRHWGVALHKVIGEYMKYLVAAASAKLYPAPPPSPTPTSPVPSNE